MVIVGAPDGGGVAGGFAGGVCDTGGLGVVGVAGPEPELHAT
jgi:hypothetical protein